MSEAILFRRQVNAWNNKQEWHNTYNLSWTTNIFTSTTTFSMPAHDGAVTVKVFGGGGGGANYSTTAWWGGLYDAGGGGGGGGNMNEGSFTNITNGQSIKITIGGGGDGVESAG